MVANQMVRADFGGNIRHSVLNILSLKCLLDKQRKQINEHLPL